jgi:2-dehydro-3-deoxyphosphogluconate aldolase/(4S)-4-hydroxy-2-oxoglutarate aldolase
MSALLDGPRVIPVLTVSDPELAVPLAQALAGGGLTTVEITLRSAAALEAIGRIRAALPDVCCGAGTLRTPADVQAAVAAGSQFLVSPGSTDALLDAMTASDLPSLPGAATPSEVMRLADQGFALQKFFPAEAAGGVRTLSALAGPLPDVSFCATGGITAANASDYLALNNVTAVGGSWMVPSAALAARDWPAITAAAAASLTAVPLV